ncbi:hypothetical protein J6E39_02760 [bacterium]|nr:hypothetical protein [bacterium]
MKKFLISLCIISFSMPAFAKANYEFTMPEQKTNPDYIASLNVPAQSTSLPQEQIYSVKTNYNEAPTSRFGKNSTTQKNKKAEKITQNGSTIIYDSGKRETITGSAAGIGHTLICLLDPYIVTLDGKEYVMIKDDNGIFEQKDILGIDDDIKNIFRALKSLESDGDENYITGEELQKAGIRLVRKKNRIIYFYDKSQDFDITLVKHIPVRSFRRTYYQQKLYYRYNRIVELPHYGTFGTFDIYTYVNKNKKTTVQNFGKVDFLKQSEIEQWISGNK